MRADNKSGKLGEAYTAKRLAENGYTILCTNYKTRFAEIDIIAKEISTNTLCFIEVKTRKSKAFGSGADYIFKSKIDKIILGARSYLAGKNFNSDIRFDVIEVYGEILPTGFAVSEFNHIKNAF